MVEDLLELVLKLEKLWRRSFDACQLISFLGKLCYWVSEGCPPPCQGHSAPRRSCGSRVYRRLSPKYIALTLGLTLRYRISKLDPTYYSCLGSYWTKDSWNATQQASNGGRGRRGGKQSGARAERAED